MDTYKAAPNNQQHMPEAALIKDEVVNILYMQAPISNSVVIVIALIYYGILQERLESGLIDLWVVLLVMAAIYRMHLWLLHRHKPAARPITSWLNHYVLGCGMVGISWSLIYPLAYSADQPFVFGALVMLALGVMSSAIPILAVSMPAFVLYTYPQGLVLSVTLLRFDDAGYHWLALSIGVYMLMITLFTRNTNQSVMRSIKLQAQNTALIDNLNFEIGQREELIAERTLELEHSNYDLRREIQDRQQTEVRLQQANADLAATLRAIPDLLFELDADGRYLNVWARDSKLLAAQKESLIGNTVTEMLPVTAADQVMAAIRAAGDQGTSHGQIIRLPIQHRDFWFELSTSKKHTADVPPHFIMLSRDITEKQHITAELDRHRRHLEDMVAQRTVELEDARKQAERLSHTKSEFLANMSHEIRTPMNGVLGMAELLGREALNERQRRYLSTIQRSGDVLLRIIDDILDFSRIESGKLEFESVRFDLAETMDDIRQLFSEAAKTKKLDFQMRSSRSAKPTNNVWSCGNV